VIRVSPSSCNHPGPDVRRELNVGGFAHPTLNAQPLEVHVPVRASVARLFGRVMPFCMTGSALLNLAVVLPFAGLQGTAWRLVRNLVN
jgi:hypothetical protein